MKKVSISTKKLNNEKKSVSQLKNLTMKKVSI